MHNSSNVDDAVPDSDPLASIPDLTSYIATDSDERIAALKLVADSVAQMRQTASRALIFHPLNMAIWVAILSVIGRYLYEDRGDLGVVVTTCAGITMALLVSVRWATSGYVFLAEDYGWAWLGDADVLVTKFGDEVIGCLVLDWVSGEGARQRQRKKAWRAEIKAWTVRLKYRHKGVGTALLEDAVREARKKGAEGIEFADEHASMSDPCISLSKWIVFG